VCSLDALTLEARASVDLAMTSHGYPPCALTLDVAGEHALIATDARALLVLTNTRVHSRDVERTADSIFEL